MEAWIWGLVGGALIGAAAVMLMALLGRVAGISGIVGSLLPPAPAEDRGWRLAFLAGLVGGPVALALTTGGSGIGAPAVGPMALALAGLLVGAGTMLGAGCTSGHGVCGVARVSPRSIAATATFMATAIATTFVVRHIL
jgi:uncharacterized membrane protein YedE/YeeE